MNGMQMAPQMPGQTPMPGQAPMMLPQAPMMQQPQGPQQGLPALVQPMQQAMDPQQLAALVQRSRSDPSAKDGWAALAALLGDIEKQKYNQAAAGQAAMQQNAQQPPGTVADQLLAAAQQMQPPVQARYGGLMRGYAGGGIVAFKDGPDEQGVRGSPAQPSPVGPFPGWQNPDIDEDGNPRSQSERAAILAYNARVQAAYERSEVARRTVNQAQPKPLSALPSSAGVPFEAIRRMQEFPPVGPRGGETPEDREALRQKLEAAPAREEFRPSMNYGERNVSPVETPPAPRPDVRTKTIARPASSPASALASTPGTDLLAPPKPANMDPMFEQRIADLQKQARTPDEVAAGRAELARMIAEDIKRRGTEVETLRAADTERLNKALADSSTYGAMDYFALAKALGGAKRGEVFGRLGEGLYGVEARKKAEQEAARKAFNEAENLRRTESNLLQKERILEKQRDLAIQERDVTTANQIQLQIFEIRAKREDVNRAAQQQEFANLIAKEEIKVKQQGAASQAESARAETKKAEAAMLAAQTRAEPPPKPVSRQQVLEQYADNWEKLDILQKNALQKQNINTFEQYVAYRDRIAGLGTSQATGAALGTRENPIKLD